MVMRTGSLHHNGSLQSIALQQSFMVQTMTGFLIYDWIEQPAKQEIIKEVLSLLEQKILEPHSGDSPVLSCSVHVGLQIYASRHFGAS